MAKTLHFQRKNEYSEEIIYYAVSQIMSKLQIPNLFLMWLMMVYVAKKMNVAIFKCLWRFFHHQHVIKGQK